ncbi:hypothetical protein LWI29_037940 [Acer saccharum]|uniref:Uncharacterized protein n=1 Tax=Acer saccharum TaxID=4024 RepID=A0AA39VZG2_ACESA|nr:hypothetical protein LWI29_037940 [Acer saccharum]
MNFEDEPIRLKSIDALRELAQANQLSVFGCDATGEASRLLTLEEIGPPHVTSLEDDLSCDNIGGGGPAVWWARR